MKSFFCVSGILLTFFLARNSCGHFTEKGHVHTISETKQTFVNRDCRRNDTCDFKRFTLTTSVYEVWFSDDPKYPTYGKGAIMEYETESVDTLENYAVVQFKKGCVFRSSKNKKGKVNRNVENTVLSFGEDIPFCFPEWVIDSQDTDPVYNSDPENGRFYLLRWNKSGSHDERTQKFYGTERPKRPIVYMADYPAGAFVTGTGVKNVALEFNTCIYKAREVPVDTRRDKIDFAKPITCFEWQNVYVYDFDKERFQTDLADVPAWEEPSTRVHVYLRLVLATLFIAVALIGMWRWGMFLNRKDRCYP